jgi:hypothetical protein
VIELEFPPGAGQWLGEIMLKRLARNALNDFYFWTWDLERKE